MKKPKIRFKGFTETWEQRKLDKIFISLQNNTFSRSDLSNEEGIAYNIHYGDILIKFNDVLNVSNEKIPMVKDINILEKFKSSHLQNGDIVVADTAEDETVGKCCEILGITDEIVISGLHTIPYRPLIKFGDRYLGYYLNSNSYHNQLLPLMQGIKVTSISKSVLKDTTILFPKQITEQEQIGSLFSKLDHLITLHQRQCENLKKLKKFMLQKLFPQNGENVPKVRFLNYTDTWEQRKLETYLQEYNEVTSTNNQYPALTSSRKGLFLQTDYFSGNQVASENNIGYNVVPYGYFTYRHMSDDEVFHFNLNDIVDKGIVSTLYPVFTTSKELDSKYLQYQLNYGEEFSRFARLQKQGGSRTYMYLNKLRKLSLTMPNTLDEQKEISAILSTLDHFITLHQSKCDKLKEVKKYMLQNMFI